MPCRVWAGAEEAGSEPGAARWGMPRAPPPPPAPLPPPKPRPPPSASAAPPTCRGESGVDNSPNRSDPNSNFEDMEKNF